MRGRLTRENATAIAVAIAAFLVYAATLCPTIYAGDSGELAVAATTLGIAHPPGYPLWTLLGRIAVLFLPGTPAFSLNLFSAICGAAAAGFVAKLLMMLGARVRLAGPRTLLPRNAAALGCPLFERIEPALEGADVVMMLRIQRERLGTALFPSLREYSRVFGLNAARLALAKPDALVMHPGPLNRGVEISEDIADGSHSVILDQVEAGVAVRMAVLAFCAKS